MARRIDITGKQYGRLTATRYIGHIKGGTVWEFLCSCGNTHVAQYVNVVHGKTRSCGCFNRDALSKRRTHGMCNTKVYHAWQAMRGRCSPTSTDKHHYYDKGIRVCDEWASSFEEFFKHIGEPPTPQHTLDRIDSTRNYEPGNVRWATWSEQQNNRSICVHIETPDGDMTIAQALRRYRVPKSSYYKRRRQGMPPLQALGEIK
jgi:hypothetical protein